MLTHLSCATTSSKMPLNTSRFYSNDSTAKILLKIGRPWTTKGTMLRNGSDRKTFSFPIVMMTMYVVAMSHLKRLNPAMLKAKPAITYYTRRRDILKRHTSWCALDYTADDKHQLFCQNFELHRTKLRVSRCLSSSQSSSSSISLLG